MRRAIVVLALFAAAGSLVAPSSAFNWADIAPRSVGANLASTANGYDGLTIVTCNGNSLTVATCNGNLVTNKATTGQSFRILKETDAGAKVEDYGIDGGAHVASGYTGWTAEKAIGSNAAFNIDFVACSALTGCSITKTYQTYWTVEGQKAGTLDVSVTKVQITVTYP